MAEERPSEDTTSEIEEQMPTSNGPSGMLIGGIVVVALLIIAGLFLPPISLGQRLGLGGGEENTAETSPTASPTETVAASNLSIPGEVDVIVSDTSAVVNVSSLSDTDAATTIGAFPAKSTVRGNVFKVEHDASVLQG